MPVPHPIDRNRHTALLTWDFPPSFSGLSRAAFDIASALTGSGNTVTVFNGALPYGERQERDGMTIIGCAANGSALTRRLRKRAGLGHLVAPWFFAKAVRAAHRATPFDVVEATNWYAPAYFLRYGPIPLVVRNSTPASDACSETMGLRDRFDMRWAHRMEQATTAAADATISNTATHKQLIERIYRGVDPQRHHVVSLALAPAMLERGAVSSWPPQGTERSVVFVGRAERRKGYREALEGFALACQQSGKPLRLHIVGMDHNVIADDKALMASLAPVQQRITYHPNISDDQLYDLYAQASAVLAPSRYESFGLVYREAAAFGRPLVACAEDPAAREFIRQADCGTLAERCSADAIATSLTHLLNDHERASDFHANGKAHAAGLTRQRLAEQTNAVYDEAIAAHTG